MIQSPAEIARWIRQREELNAKQKELVVRLQNLLSFKKRKGKFDGTNTENLRRVTRPVHLALEMVDGCFQTLWTRLQTTGRLKNLPEQVQSDIHLLKDAFDDMSCCLKLACVYPPDLEKYFNHPYSYCRLLLQIEGSRFYIGRHALKALVQYGCCSTGMLYRYAHLIKDAVVILA